MKADVAADLPKKSEQVRELLRIQFSLSFVAELFLGTVL
jgi:hypothetical protein